VEEDMKDQFKDLLAPDGLLSRLLYIVLFAVIFWLCEFILIALVIFQYLHLVLTGEKNDKVTPFAEDFSAYLGAVSAYLTLASEERPFPFQDWKAEAAPEPVTSPATTEPTESPRPTVRPRKKAASKKTAAKKTTSKKTSKKTARKTVKKSAGKK